MLPEFRSSRLHLRPVRAADRDDLWSLWTDPEVRRFLFDDLEVTPMQVGELLTQWAPLAAQGLGLWMMESLEDGESVGNAGLFPCSVAAEFEPRLAGTVEPVVALAPSYWHRGLAAESLATLIGYAFSELALPRLGAAVDLPNTASHELVGRLGFELLSECAGPKYPMRTYVLTPDAFARRGTIESIDTPRERPR